METVIVYTRTSCPLCEDAIALLHMLQLEYDIVIEERDIETNDEWLEAYQLVIPVVEVKGRQLNAQQINDDTLKQLLHEK
ncbi:glutaredoxin family protein [Lentibacillus saliphilus]|uniref:glutaredoxin family protein n=1 Tax=Lentibacillus saliphilus TaxID=2737028 RepID=UPI001C2FD322